MAARALEFAILTAGRSGEVYGARWTEFDLDKKVWTIPAERMKAGREHRVPLCRRVAEIVEEMARVKVGQFVFPGRGSDKPLSHVAMAKVIDRVAFLAAGPMETDRVAGVFDFEAGLQGAEGDCAALRGDPCQPALRDRRN